MILAVTIAVLIAIVWFGYRSHLKEQQRASEEHAAQQERQRLYEVQRHAKAMKKPSRLASTVQATETRNDMTDPLNPLSPFSQLHPLNPMAHHLAPDIDCSTRRSYDPSPSCSGSSSYSSSSDSSSSSSSSSSCSGGCGSSD